MSSKQQSRGPSLGRARFDYHTRHRPKRRLCSLCPVVSVWSAASRRDRGGQTDCTALRRNPSTSSCPSTCASSAGLGPHQRHPGSQDRSLEAMSSEIPITYVPARNTIFCPSPWRGPRVPGSKRHFPRGNVLDYSGYPDCRTEYIEAFAKMANLATKAAVGRKAATYDSHSADPLDQGRRSSAADWSWSRLRADDRLATIHHHTERHAGDAIRAYCGRRASRRLECEIRARQSFEQPAHRLVEVDTLDGGRPGARATLSTLIFASCLSGVRRDGVGDDDLLDGESRKAGIAGPHKTPWARATIDFAGAPFSWRRGRRRRRCWPWRSCRRK